MIFSIVVLDKSAQNRSPSRQPHESCKRWALLKEHHNDELLHISTASPGRSYYHPVSLDPMYARVNHSTPHFCYKNPASIDPHPVDPNERVRQEGAIHGLVKRVLAREKQITLLVDGETKTLSFNRVESEYRPRDFPLRRIDLVCTIASPRELAKRFGGGINIEVVCHHGVDIEKENVLKKLGYAALTLRIHSKMLRELEVEEAQAMSGVRPITPHKIKQWEARIRGYLRKPFNRNLIHIPGELDPRVLDSRRLPPSETDHSNHLKGAVFGSSLQLRWRLGR